MVLLAILLFRRRRNLCLANLIPFRSVFLGKATSIVFLILSNGLEPNPIEFITSTISTASMVYFYVS